MDSTEGLVRGMDVTDTGAPISVPVGEVTLGRLMNVTGDPVDEAGPISSERTMPIHRVAPDFADQATEVEILETGIKVIDLVCPTRAAARSDCSAALAWARPSPLWS